MGKHYTAEQDALIMKEYPVIGVRVADLLPDHDEKSVIYRAKRLGCHTNTTGKGEPWNKDELEILRNNFYKMGTTVICLLPNRTCRAIINKAHEIGIRSPLVKMDNDGKNDKWSRAEDRVIIKTCYDYVNNTLKYDDKLLDLLPDRSEGDIRLRVNNLAKYRNGILGGYPINVYIAITGSHKNYPDFCAQFADLVEAAFTAIRSNSNKPEVAKKIVEALELHYKFGMDISDIAEELCIKEDSAKWLLNTGIRFVKQVLKR